MPALRDQPKRLAATGLVKQILELDAAIFQASLKGTHRHPHPFRHISQLDLPVIREPLNQQARHVSDSLRKGDNVLVAGELRFGTYIDKDSGQTRETRDIVADNVGASLKFVGASIERSTP